MAFIGKEGKGDSSGPDLSLGALAGIRVIDLSRVLAGPWCGQTLADLGAEVIKIERLDLGDDTRGWGPPWMRSKSNANSESAYFQSANRGKSSLAVDIAHPEGQAIVRALVLRADVLIENFKVGTLARYGLDFETLSALNPRLVYCSITGYGQTGPRAAEPGYDFVIQAHGGLMSITGERDDRAGGGPQKVGVAIADLMTGLYATVAIQAALLSRETTGVGQHCDLALFDVQLATLANQAMSFLATGHASPRHGNAHASIVPYQVFQAQDGAFVVACGNDSQFAALVRCLELADLNTDPRFLTNSDRIAHRDHLEQILAKRFASATVDEWVRRITAAGVPASAINNIAEAFADPQTDAREMIVGLPHSMDADFTVVGSPIKLSGTPVQYNRPPPLLGEHSEQVLRGHLGLSESEIAALVRRKIVQRILPDWQADVGSSPPKSKEEYDVARE